MRQPFFVFWLFVGDARRETWTWHNGFRVLPPLRGSFFGCVCPRGFRSRRWRSLHATAGILSPLSRLFVRKKSPVRGVGPQPWVKRSRVSGGAEPTVDADIESEPRSGGRTSTMPPDAPQSPLAFRSRHATAGVPAAAMRRLSSFKNTLTK